MYKNGHTVETDLNRHFSRFEDPLWDDSERDAPPTIVRVRICKDENTFKAEVLEDNKVKFVIDGRKLTKKQLAFVKSGEGLQFIIAQYKKGVKNISNFKKVLGAHVKAKHKGE